VVSAKVIPPGGEGQVKATFDTKGRKGKTNKKIYIYSNDPSNSKYALSLKGEIVVEVEVNPTRLNFGNYKKKQTGSLDFFVTIEDPEKVRVSSVAIKDRRFSIEPGRVDSTGKAHYKVKFLGSDTSGRISKKIKISLEGASTPYIDMVVQVTVVSDIVYRKSLDFRQQKGKYAPMEVSFKTRSGVPVEILDVEDTGGLLETEILERKGHRSALKAYVLDPEAVPSHRGRHKLIVSTNHEEEPEVEITYRIALPRTR
jgi:hypothetical protein